MPAPELTRRDRPAAFVTSTDGTPIACWRYGDGPPLLLVHGSGEDHSRWHRVGGALARRFTVYAMDRRGRGASGDGTRYGLDLEAADIVAVLASIGVPANVLGHSYGALCCLEAIALGARVEKLVLHEPCLPHAATTARSPLAERLQELLDNGDREDVVVTFFREVVRAPTRYVGFIRAQPGFSALVAAAHTLTRELTATDGYELQPERFRDVGVPVLLLTGSDLESPFLQAAASAIRSALPDLREGVLPGRLHFGMGITPAQVTDVVTEFLLRSP